MMRRRLVDAGLRATLAPTTDGPRVLVFPEDVKTARLVLRAGGHTPLGLIRPAESGSRASAPPQA